MYRIDFWLLLLVILSSFWWRMKSFGLMFEDVYENCLLLFVIFRRMWPFLSHEKPKLVNNNAQQRQIDINNGQLFLPLFPSWMSSDNFLLSPSIVKNQMLTKNVFALVHKKSGYKFSVSESTAPYFEQEFRGENIFKKWSLSVFRWQYSLIFQMKCFISVITFLPFVSVALGAAAVTCPADPACNAATQQLCVGHYNSVTGCTDGSYCTDTSC